MFGVAGRPSEPLRRLPVALADPSALVWALAVPLRPRIDDAARRSVPYVPVPSAALFAWSGGGIVLLGERDAGRWILARGWRQCDRLSDVRRWFFGDPRAFAGQVRRLVRDATADPTTAAAAHGAALAWVGSDGSRPG